MKKVLLGVVVTLIFVLVFRSCSDDKKEQTILQENSMLIQQQIENVSKLIVTEGHFAEVYNYKDSQLLFGSLISANKKALVVVNAEVTMAYDLSKIDFEIDEPNKILRIKSLPEAEVKINPDFEYYDVSADYFNPFDERDYNRIKKNVNNSLLKKIEASSLKTNAQNRLMSELQKFYILTNSMEWTLEYQGEAVEQNFSGLPFKD
ncbi:DUF4230 domain-containing protein [Aurantibacter crassamenti]|uniref:DUF4230 domain-containing protein n=1 Tax=Aurantibacter crassamenti TaxID=1837375 RepID=UPI001939409B|nr:DUF4230 domain-containing protein [Aurantibacter crassamenti]MBM1105907.1 DUF4230 domain-containing protein [Aurantibacter crassamenti]